MREVDLPTVVEELANMVAVSGEELEDIARGRNEETPELRFLHEKEGELYRQYRARVEQIQSSFEESKQEPRRKRKSRWGDKEPDPVVERPAPTSSRQSNPSVVAYAHRVFGSSELSSEQWKQCEDQVKMAALYAELAAKQVRARLGGGGGKVQYDYDSDEDTEGGEEEGGGESLYCTVLCHVRYLGTQGQAAGDGRHYRQAGQCDRGGRGKTSYRRFPASRGAEQVPDEIQGRVSVSAVSRLYQAD